ncbi:MAG: 1,6-anhydro-N-acetylmuramyl-L-alanine amidase AmpD, partial [Proteobacteria bacterium]|nr:1,6-anhydro-N-acetylmuramyl-L-alanine amidase AmpD [Pseudomonadota bacterium]
LIRRDGEVIQYVSLDKRAWHAGISNFKGRDKCNDFSIGIELEGCDDVPYTDIQYLKLAEVTKILQNNWPSLSQIAGHCDIAPERKTDPGPLFDWERFRKSILR